MYNYFKYETTHHEMLLEQKGKMIGGQTEN